MNLKIIFNITCMSVFLIDITGAITIIPATEQSTKDDRRSNKRGLLIGDLSYSYSATDIGSVNGSHIKTITVIKNLSVPKHKKQLSEEEAKELIKNAKNQYKYIVHVHDFPQLPPFNFYHSDSDNKKPQDEPQEKPIEKETNAPKKETEDGNGTPIFEELANDEPEMMENNQDSLNESQEAPMTGKYRDRFNSDNLRKLPDDVEYIEMVPFSIDETSKTAQSQSPKIKYNRDKNRFTIIDHQSITNDKQNKFSSNRQAPNFDDDFSVHSNPNAKQKSHAKPNHTNNSSYKIPVRTYESLKTHTKGEINQNEPRKSSSQQYIKSGDLKSQSYLDVSHIDGYTYKEREKYIQQRPGGKYISPSIQKSYATTTTTTLRPFITQNYDTKAYKIFASTSQRPYIAPTKAANIQQYSHGIKSLGDYYSSPSTTAIPYQAPNVQSKFLSKYKIQPHSFTNPSLPPETNTRKGNAHTNKPNQKIVRIKPVKRVRSSESPSPIHESDVLQRITSTFHLPNNVNDLHSNSNPAIPLMRHPYVFESSPPYSFMSSPFRAS